MSVRKWERDESRNSAVDISEKVLIYTLGICTTEKHFPKRYRWCMTKEIVEEAFAINKYTHKAYGCYPKDKSSAMLRIRYIDMAISETSSFLNLISIAKQMFQVQLNQKTVNYWLDTASYLKTLLQKWRDLSRNNLDGLPE